MVFLKWNRPSNEVWLFLVVMVAMYILYVLRNYLRNVKLAFELPGPRALPLLGNAHSLLEDDLIHRIGSESWLYGRIFRVWVSVLPYVVLVEPEDIQLVLGNAKHNKKIYVYKLLENFIGKGLISEDTDKWNLHRKVLQPAFHFHILERFIESFAASAGQLVDVFLENEGKAINITSLINDSIYVILSETILGITNTSSLNGAKNDSPFRKGQVMAMYRMARPWLLLNSIYRLTRAGQSEKKQRRDLVDVCFKMMKEKRELLRSTKPDEKKKDARRKISLLDYMIEMNEKNPSFTDEDIVEQCCTFMLAGQDSVGTTTALTVFLLAQHPEWQERCAKELEDIFGGDSRCPTMNDLKAMKCLEMCIKETLRLYPSVPIIGRTLGENVKIGDRVIRAGCGVIVSPYSTHRSPRYFPDPSAYKPERFSSENSEKLHPYAYIPFSAGPRNCIGHKFAMLEMKCIISAILRNCRLETIAGKDEIHLKFRMTIRAQGGLWVKVISRNRLNSNIIE
ncbi:hypothetical protein KM043_010736 [Ampulex compressa]|nr:hypothetical protein KM043_010736 [Ampulex compressa]